MKIYDETGVIKEAMDILPEDHKILFLNLLAELENKNYHIKKEFPTARVHKVKGIDKTIFRADINKSSGWRLHFQYSAYKELKDTIVLKQILEGQKHDILNHIIKKNKNRYD